VILNDLEIERLCKEQAMVLPFSPDQLNPASYDVRLGDQVMIESVASSDFVRTPTADSQKRILGYCALGSSAWLPQRSY